MPISDHLLNLPFRKKKTDVAIRSSKDAPEVRCLSITSGIGGLELAARIVFPNIFDRRIGIYLMGNAVVPLQGAYAIVLLLKDSEKDSDRSSAT